MIQILSFVLALGLSTLQAKADHREKLLGLYEFHVTFPAGPTYADQFRIDNLGLRAETTRTKVYDLQGAFISPEGFGEKGLADGTLRVESKQGFEFKVVELRANFQAEGQTIAFAVNFVVSDVGDQVLATSGSIRASFGTVQAFKINKLNTTENSPEETLPIEEIPDSEMPEVPEPLRAVNTFTVTCDFCPSGYAINGNRNPSLTLVRGQTYVFEVRAPGHPFAIHKSSGNPNRSDRYDNGVTGQATEVVTFTVPMDAPDTLHYQCEFHSGMTGELTIVDPS